MQAFKCDFVESLTIESTISCFMRCNLPQKFGCVLWKKCLNIGYMWVSNKEDYEICLMFDLEAVSLC